MLMPLMRRTLLVFILLAGAAIALEPVIHTHRLTQNSSSSQCAVCVNAHARVTTLAPAAISPLAAFGAVPRIVVLVPVQCADTPLASRAPPAV